MRRLIDRQFNGLHCSAVSKPSGSFLANPLACKADSFDYVPGMGSFIEGPDRLELNQWRGSGIIAEQGSCETILKHFDFIFPDDDVRAHWLNYFSSIAQDPSKKINHCLLLIGSQGTGKSFFKKLLKKLLGSNNVGLVDTGAWQESFNAHILNKQVCVIEELMAGKRLESYNELKQYISEPFVIANEKHVSQYEARTPYAMMAFSNHRKPILLEETDRRFHVYHSPVVARDKPYYRALHEALETELPAFLFRLLNRDLSKFSPEETPPETETKRELIALSEAPLKTIVRSLIDEGAAPLHRDLVTIDQVRNAIIVSDHYPNRIPSVAMIAETFLSLGAITLGQQRIEGLSSKPSLWAIRNVEKWRNAKIQQRTAEFTRVETAG